MKKVVIPVFLLVAVFASLLTAQESGFLRSKEYNEAAPHLNPQQTAPAGESEPYWQLFWEVPAGVGGGEAGIESDGNYIYTTKWNGGSEFYRYAMDGTYIETFSCGSASAIRDLAWDGTYFYGGAAGTTVFEMDFENQVVVSTITAPVDVRAIAYDDSRNGFYANNWSTDITLFDRSGNVMDAFAVGNWGSYYGFAYQSDDRLYGFSQDGSGGVVVEMYLPSGEESGFTYDVVAELGDPGNDLAGGCAFPNLGGSYAFLGLIQNTALFAYDTYINPLVHDVGIRQIVEPTSGLIFGNSEPITIVIGNDGYFAETGIPYEVTWNNGSYSDEFTSTLAPGASVEITLPVTADMSNYGEYVFEACTNLPGDENPSNDCKTKSISYIPPGVCIDNLYTEGCAAGDGLISWHFGNVAIDEIPCSGSPEWYHTFADPVHEFYPGTWLLTVVAGHDDTWFNVWLNKNDEPQLSDAQLILGNAHCDTAGKAYTYYVNIPETAAPGPHQLRFRTRRGQAVEDACESYTYGNCCDFRASVVSAPGPVIQIYTDTIRQIHSSGQESSFREIMIHNGSDSDTLSFDVSIEYTDRKNEKTDRRDAMEYADAGPKGENSKLDYTSLCYPTYSGGCQYGDGLIAWELANISLPDIPCEGQPSYFHDYTGMIHFLTPGTHQLTVKAGYDDTYFDVWINYDGINDFQPSEQLLDNAYCEKADTAYTFTIEIPDTLPTEHHVLRFLTNWQNGPGHPCASYSYGNAADFTAITGNLQPGEWLLTGYHHLNLAENQFDDLKLLFYSAGLAPGIYTADLVFTSNDPVNPVVTVPVEFSVLGNSLNPPQNLLVSVTGNEVSMEWDAPEPTTSSLLGYHVYLDGEMISDTVAATSYAISGCPDGSHWVSVSALYDDGESEWIDPVHVEVGAATGKLQGFIRDAVTKLNVASAWVSANDVEFGAVSYSTPFGSHYSLHLPAGTYSVSCNADGYQAMTFDNVVIAEGGTRALNFYLDPEVSDFKAAAGSLQPDGSHLDSGSPGDEILIYPNPAKEQITIRSAGRMVSVTVQDINGPLIHQTCGSAKEVNINTSGLEPGVYILKIKTVTGIHMKKLVIK